MRLRELIPADTPAVHALLRECRLPTDGVPEDGALFRVADSAGKVVGVAGLELHGGHGLLRSVAVSPAHRGRGLASRLCDEVEARAAALGARRLFLLTETAERFFSRRGYARSARSLAPPEIAKSREFAAVCPDSATLMFREL
jgi:amino-acid N-acetyltransferase